MFMRQDIHLTALCTLKNIVKQIHSSLRAPSMHWRADGTTVTLGTPPRFLNRALSNGAGGATAESPTCTCLWWLLYSLLVISNSELPGSNTGHRPLGICQSWYFSTYRASVVLMFCGHLLYLAWICWLTSGRANQIPPWGILMGGTLKGFTGQQS